ncbi:MAG: hypothetical protein AAGE59_32395 [Cyanobacteria bacterium P01_F01_bin.86]
MKTKLILYDINGGSIAGVNIDATADPVTELDRILDGQLQEWERPIIRRVITQRTKG